MKTRKIDWLASAGICSAEAATMGEALYPPAGGAPAPEPTPAPAPEPAPAPAPTPEPAPAPAEPAPAPAPGDPAPGSAIDPAPEPAPAPAPITAESYVFTYPEGFTEDAEVMAGIKATLAKASVPPEIAQELVTTHVEQLKAAVAAGVAASQTQFSEMNSKWVTEINAMPEFQGEAKKQTSATLGRVWDEFGSPEAKEAFNLTGAGNNPAIVRMFLKMAAALSEGRPAAPGAPAGSSPSQQTRGQKLYGSKT